MAVGRPVVGDPVRVVYLYVASKMSGLLAGRCPVDPPAITIRGDLRALGSTGRSPC
jgi:hypothetical protein